MSETHIWVPLPLKIRILLADDHAIVRRGLRRILAQEPDWEVCAEAEDGEQAVALAAQHRPDIAILDFVMPGLDGIKAAQQIRAMLPDCEIAIVSMHETEELRQAAIAAGVASYLLKSEVEVRLIPTVRSLAGHRTYVPSGPGSA
jgi:DNA-binding NarL/FixJ family response regulator